jgi:Holliday junction resolvase RusA-like endonuclease
MTETTGCDCTLRVTLPGVVSWSRPRRDRGGMRYPRGYARNRDAWATVVAHAVLCQQWRTSPTVRYCVTVTVHGGGKRDLDRVCTAVLDALQAGAAVRDDCLVDALTATRFPIQQGKRPTTVVEVVSIPRGNGRRRHVMRSPAATASARQKGEHRAR